MPAKRCSRCRAVKDLAEFARSRARRDGFSAFCKPCHNLVAAENKIKLHGSQRSFLLKLRYGLDAATFDRMSRARSGLCDICRVRPGRHVDHDHATGRVRGLLCFNCNRGLGYWKDRRELILAAIDYLRRPA